MTRARSNTVAIGSRRRITSLAVAGIVALPLLALPTQPADAGAINTTRLFGSTRFDTAVAVSAEAWPGKAEEVFIATGNSFADALVAGAAAADRGPVLLVTRDGIPAVTAAELSRLNATKAWILGGTAAISDATMAQVAARMGPDTETVRLSGSNRFATAAAITGQFFAGPVARVYLVNGHSFQDGLAAAAAAGAEGVPVLTTESGRLTATTAAALDSLQPAEVVIVGGEANVSVAVEVDLRPHTDLVRRLAGDSAEETAAIVSRSTFARADIAFISSADTFPDGLAGGAYAGKLGAPLLLVDPNRLTSGPGCELARLGVSQVRVLGGPGAISSSVVSDISGGIDVRSLGCSTGILTEIADPNPQTEVSEVTLYDLVISPDNKTAYVVNNHWNSVEVIELATGAHVDTIPVGSDPADIEITPDGTTIFVVNNGGQDISVVDVATRREVARPSLPITTAGTNDGRTWSVASAGDGRNFLTTLGGVEADLPPLMEIVANGSSWNISNDPQGIVTDANLFRSADYETLAVIADGGQGERIQYYDIAAGLWLTSDLSWGLTPVEAAFGTVAGPNDAHTWVVISDGASTLHVATGDEGGSANDYRLLGTVTSDATSGWGLAMAPDRRTAYRVVTPADGTPGAIEVIDVDSAVDHEGSFRVKDVLPMRSSVLGYGATNQPVDVRIENQLAISPDGTILVAVTEGAVEIFHLVS